MWNYDDASKRMEEILHQPEEPERATDTIWAYIMECEKYIFDAI
tara:strand:- start:106 stop:237 length:132 start_codon:yes stop_codon:yes gene_type:complete